MVSIGLILLQGHGLLGRLEVASASGEGEAAHRGQVRTTFRGSG